MASKQEIASPSATDLNREEIIRNNVTTFRDYLEKHVSVKDLVGHSDLFDREQKNELLLTAQTKPALATKQALDIIERHSRSDKYTHLLEVIQESGYPKLVGLLNGNFVHTNDYHINRLNWATPLIYQRLSPSEAIPYLFRNGVVCSEDAAEISKLESNKSRAEAALALQYILPSRHRYWYQLTIKSLVESGQGELAEAIDPDITKAIQFQDKSDSSVCGSDVSLEPVPTTDLTVDYGDKANNTMACVGGLTSWLSALDEQSDQFCRCNYVTYGNVKEAKHYCSDCSEYFCESCLKSHTKSTMLKHHRITGPDRESAGSGRRLTVYCGCNRDREAEIYCEDHADVICNLCRNVKHQFCQTSHIQLKSSGYVRADLESIISRAKSLKVKYDQIKQECLENVQKLEISKETCRNEIKLFRKELDTFLDTLENMMLEELELSESMEYQRIDGQITTLTETLQLIETDCQMLDKAKNDERKDVMFATDLGVSNRLQRYENRLEILDRDVRNPNISFEKNKEISALQNKILSFGTLKMSENTEQRKPKIVMLGQQITSHRKVNVRLANDRRVPRITGSTNLSNAHIVLCDRDNQKMKLLDGNFVIIDSCAISGGPFDVSVLDANNVIVTIPDKKQIQMVRVLPQLQMSLTIQLDKKCWGVAVSRENIYVSCHNNPGEGEVRVLDKHGNLERRLGVGKDGFFLFLRPHNITVNRGGDKIFVSDLKNSTVTCLTMGGTIIYQYKDLTHIYPHGLYCDDSNNILVCSRDSHTVFVITADGKLYNTILSSKDGLKGPRSVIYIQSHNILAVGCAGLNHLLLYHLTQKT